MIMLSDKKTWKNIEAIFFNRILFNGAVHNTQFPSFIDLSINYLITDEQNNS